MSAIPISSDRSARHSSASNEHATPMDIVDRARTLLGGTIDLDPASCALAQSRIRAAHWCGLDHPDSDRRDGLAIDWDHPHADHRHPSRAFLNPPGAKTNGQSNAKLWWFKLAHEYMEDRVRSAIFVGFSIEILQTTQIQTPNGSNGHPLPTPLEFLICVPRRRIAFDAMTHSGFVPGNSPTHANVIVYLPPMETRYSAERKRFTQIFANVGRVAGLGD